jgi:hypothetical protein
MNKLSKFILVLIIASLSTMSFAHSGRTDSNGGHNCSDKSKRKGLCTGYHYHKKPKINDASFELVEKNQKVETKTKVTISDL